MAVKKKATKKPKIKLGIDLETEPWAELSPVSKAEPEEKVVVKESMPSVPVLSDAEIRRRKRRR
jgi:hypothetical protein